MKEYAIYPFQTMNISQNYNQGNHIPHWKDSTNYSDKPWDEAGADSGRDYFIPQNDFVVEEILGINTNVTNSVRLRSVNKIYIPYKNDADYLYLTLTHMNEDNLGEIRVGQVLKKGMKILREGNDGLATGNHFHITANIGKYYGLLKNSNGAWCYTYEKSLLPEEAFYVDHDFTSIIDSKGSSFLSVPQDILEIGTPILRDEKLNELEIKVSNLRCRTKPSLDSEIIGYLKKGIYNYFDSIESDGYVWYNVGIGYVAYHNDWINVYSKHEDYPEEITDIDHQKENASVDSGKETDNQDNEKKYTVIFQFLINFIKKFFNYLIGKLK